MDRFFKIWLIGVCLSIIAQTFGCIMGTAFGSQVRYINVNLNVLNLSKHDTACLYITLPCAV